MPPESPADLPLRRPTGPAELTGLILCGGAARRMGGQDKGLMDLAGRPLAAWTLEAIRPQVADLVISANRNLDQYRQLGVTVVADRRPDLPGPLAGIEAALAVISTPWLLVVPCDTPLLPPDLGARLAAGLGRDGATIAVAADRERTQPLHALLPADLGADLTDYLEGGGRRVLGWLERHPVAVVRFAEPGPAFANANTPAALALLADRLKTSIKQPTAG